MSLFVCCEEGTSFEPCFVKKIVPHKKRMQRTYYNLKWYAKVMEISSENKKVNSIDNKNVCIKYFYLILQ